MPDFYYLILWKGYQDKKNTSEPALAVMHLQKLINTFYKKYSEKLTTIFPLLNSALPMARSSLLKKPK